MILESYGLADSLIFTHFHPMHWILLLHVLVRKLPTLHKQKLKQKLKQTLQISKLANT